ncbi:MAG: hypothetical protein ACI9U2_004819, partial [Bradymonadia bacterium]
GELASPQIVFDAAPDSDQSRVDASPAAPGSAVL